jgi:hypothetical protein
MLVISSMVSRGFETVELWLVCPCGISFYGSCGLVPCLEPLVCHLGGCGYYGVCHYLVC